MKKHLLLLVPVLLLASCTGAGSSWNIDDATLMNEHLNGYEIPYIHLERLTVSYNRELDCISIDAPEATNEQFENYKNNVEKEGYVEIKHPCLNDLYTSLGLHTYSKNVAGGVIFLDVYCIEDDRYSTNGEFNIDAYFYEIVSGEYTPYTWTVVDKRIMTTFLDGFIMPNCNIANNQVYFEEYISSKDDTPYAEKGTVIIEAPHATQTEVQTYIDILKKDGFESVTTGSEDIGFFEVKKQHSDEYEVHVQLYTYYDEIHLGLEGIFYADVFCKKIGA